MTVINQYGDATLTRRYLSPTIVRRTTLLTAPQWSPLKLFGGLYSLIPIIPKSVILSCRRGCSSTLKYLPLVNIAVLLSKPKQYSMTQNPKV